MKNFLSLLGHFCHVFAPYCLKVKALQLLKLKRDQAGQHAIFKFSQDFQILFKLRLMVML